MAGFTKAFQQTHMAQQDASQLAQPYVAPNPKCNEALIQHRYALTGNQSHRALSHSIDMLQTAHIWYSCRGDLYPW